jgi:CheY-like chemotaxis protein
MPSARKILVVDDDPMILEMMVMALQEAGYEVTTAASGAETISRVNGFQPDLILMDLNFPPCSENFQSTLEDGFLIVSWLRGMSSASKIPVIIISGADPMEYRDRAWPKNVVAILQKPMDINWLIEYIRTALDSRRQADQKSG